ncbi:DUF1501 domain-containing protein [Rubellicoccus peritrichatus]|uniref:DUF1501 domain-containing protein n=1 Tax=Rubellicoccus peritrichatus TaxID=3080537 RepID=A0AAQ3L8S2_9BACT|nr:DUF1501 domain-containing protein [Puniceicoccus sp. CR14]WOO39385.1 DUF1501 domain-containing protein [Puniceicoccus sp. CR14]
MSDSEAFKSIKAAVSRRTFLKRSLTSMGAFALGDLLASSDAQSAWKGTFGDGTHHLPKVKRVIHLCMAGGPSHLETFDYKPELERLNGQAMPESFTKGEQLAQLQGSKLNVMGPISGFERRGQCGMMVNEQFPHIGSIADDIAVVRSMYTEQINHDPAHTFMNTGSIIPGRPCMGAWTLYGLGSLSSNLPGYVVLTSVGGGQGQPISSKQWHNGFLPSKFQGVPLQSKGDPVYYVNNPDGIHHEAQGDLIDTVNQLNHMHLMESHDKEIAARISQYELAFRMQTSVPELTDFSNEPKHVFDLYGCQPGDGSFASNCLMARRLAERGVRFIQLYHRGWDHHGNIRQGFPVAAKHVDQGTAALIKDLKMRGLLEDTLVIWGGEFGRTPMSQGSGEGAGRDHHIKGFSIFLAGGGIKGGTVYGSTDELGYSALENPTSVHDLHMTMLYLLGVDHKRLNFRFQGRDFRLTDVHGKLIKGILA